MGTMRSCWGSTNTVFRRPALKACWLFLPWLCYREEPGKRKVTTRGVYLASAMDSRGYVRWYLPIKSRLPVTVMTISKSLQLTSESLLLENTPQKSTSVRTVAE